MPDQSNRDDVESDVRDIEIDLSGYLPKKEVTEAKENSN